MLNLTSQSTGKKLVKYTLQNIVVKLPIRTRGLRVNCVKYMVTITSVRISNMD